MLIYVSLLGVSKYLTTKAAVVADLRVVMNVPNVQHEADVGDEGALVPPAMMKIALAVCFKHVVADLQHVRIGEQRR